MWQHTMISLDEVDQKSKNEFALGESFNSRVFEVADYEYDDKIQNKK